MYVFPWRLLKPRSQKTALQGRVVTGGTSLSGQQQAGSLAGGGFWASDWSNIHIQTPDQIRCARAWAAHLDGGAQQFILPVWSLRTAPLPAGAAPAPPAPSADYFAQEPGFAAQIMGGVISAAPLRATGVTLQVTTGTPFKGGETFSVNHPTKSWRMYDVMQAQAPDGNGRQACTIRPPLREALPLAVVIELDVPRFVAQLAPAKAGDFAISNDPGGYTTISAGFVEAFG